MDNPVAADEVYLNRVVNINLLLLPFVGRLMGEFAQIDGIVCMLHLDIFGKAPEFLFADEVLVNLGAGETYRC